MANRYYDEYRQPHDGASPFPNIRPMQSTFGNKTYSADSKWGKGTDYNNNNNKDDDNPPSGGQGARFPRNPKTPKGPLGKNKRAPERVTTQEFYPAKKLFKSPKEIVNTPVGDPTRILPPIFLPRKG